MSTIEKISPVIDAKIKELIKPQVEEESQVIVHLTFVADGDMLIRIWPSTYLYPHHSNHVSELVHTENITLYPEWTSVRPGATHTFTLVFQGLPHGCKHFDLIELITESGGFEFKNIARNNTDVYHLKIA
jgi:hypothetical protein